MNNIVNEIRTAQLARYVREDKSILDALSQANAYLSAQYNLDEEVKQLWSSTQIWNTYRYMLATYIQAVQQQKYLHGYQLAQLRQCGQ